MDKTKFTNIFRNGSKTFFNSARLFPKQIRQEITVLYAFVRSADNMVDMEPADKKGFRKFASEFEKARKGEKVADEVIQQFVELEKEKGFDKKWTDAFLEAMESDLTIKQYRTIEDVEKYMYGSADVIGLFMAKLMNLPETSYPAAQTLGKAFQFVNFVRDISEDRERGRNYIPMEDINKFGLASLEPREVEKNEEGFANLIRFEIERYRKWQAEAEKGFKYIPKKYLIPIKTASDLYKWTAEKIEINPAIVLEKSVKPGNLRIIATGISNWF